MVEFPLVLDVAGPAVLLVLFLLANGLLSHDLEELSLFHLLLVLVDVLLLDFLVLLLEVLLELLQLLLLRLLPGALLLFFPLDPFLRLSPSTKVYSW